jgi:YVTN family beta-propeller protein
VIDGATNNVITAFTVQDGAGALVYNPTNNKVYCASPGDVTVIDGAGDSVITAITNVSDRRALVYNPTNNKVYCTYHSCVNVIDGASNAVMATIPVGATPVALVYNPTNNKVYCANWESDDVTVIDGANNAVITTIAAGDMPGAFVYNPTNNKVYCASANEVTVIDGATNAVITNITVGWARHALVYDPNHNKVYCANWLDDNVTVIDGATNAVITTVGVGDGPGALIYNPTNNKLYCANSGSIYGPPPPLEPDSTVTVIDGGWFNPVLTTIAVGSGPCAFTWNPVQNRTYVANYCGSSVSVIRDVVAVEEEKLLSISRNGLGATIFRGPLQLPDGKKCKVFDITGRVVEPSKIQPGIYFIEIDGVVTQKVVKVK